MDKEANIIEVDGRVEGVPQEVAAVRERALRGRADDHLRTHPQATATVLPTLSSQPHSLSALRVSERKQANARGSTMNTWKRDTTWMFLRGLRAQPPDREKSAGVAAHHWFIARRERSLP